MKKIYDAKNFEFQFNSIFGSIDRNTLSSIEEDKLLRIELGGQGNDITQRLEQAYSRSNDILQFCFGKKPLWLRIIMWTNKEKENLINGGFELDKATKIFKQNDVLYINFEHYSKRIIAPITQSNINFDLKIDPYSHITCYYINFNLRLIINIYDDRGLDIFTANKELLGKIKDKFSDWII